jgi:hypothetical protein
MGATHRYLWIALACGSPEDINDEVAVRTAGDIPFGQKQLAVSQESFHPDAAGQKVYAKALNMQKEREGMKDHLETATWSCVTGCRGQFLRR